MIKITVTRPQITPIPLRYLFCIKNKLKLILIKRLFFKQIVTLLHTFKMVPTLFSFYLLFSNLIVES